MESTYNGVHVPGSCYHAARSQSSSAVAGAGVIVCSFRNPGDSGRVMAVEITRFGLALAANAGTLIIGLYARICRNYTVEDTGGNLSVNTRLCSSDPFGKAQFRLNSAGFLTAGTREIPENAMLMGDAIGVKAGDLGALSATRTFTNPPLILLPNEGIEFVNARAIPSGTTASFGIELDWTEMSLAEWERVRGKS